MYFSKTMWSIIKEAYVYKRITKKKFFLVASEVSSTIPRFLKRYFVIKNNTVEKQFKFRLIRYKICGYPLHKFGFWDRKNHKPLLIKKKSQMKGSIKNLVKPKPKPKSKSKTKSK